MFWTKLILLNMSLFIIWGKIFSYLLIQWKLNDYLSIESIELETKLEDFNMKYKDLLEINHELNPLLDEIRKSYFFRIFKINFDTACNFWTQNKICNFSTCSICQCDESEVPLPWKQDSIFDTVDKVNNDKMDFFNNLISKYNYSSNDWLIESEIDNKNGIFVNLLKNPETWTNYQGQKLWEAIYRENCFSKSFDEMCVEEKLFYRIISGLHTNINLHLSQNYLKSDINSLNGKNETNIDEFVNDEYNELHYTINSTIANDRVFLHPDRLNNLFYLYSIMLNSVKKAESTVKNYEYETGNNEEDSILKKRINSFYNKVDSLEKLNTLRSEVKKNSQIKMFMTSNKVDELKMRFRNISEIMDCVGCQKCKLHGKLQIYGLATMFKILFDNKENTSVKRNELISFINLSSKIARSIDNFEKINAEGIRVKEEYKRNIVISISLYIIFAIIFNFIYIKNGYLEKRWFDHGKDSKEIREKKQNEIKKNGKIKNSYFVTSKENSEENYNKDNNIRERSTESRNGKKKLD